MTAQSQTVGAEGGGAPRQIEAAIRRQVEQLSYLPGSAAVAIKFIELGKDPDAGPADYEKIISADAALSAKLLSLANSSWFATRHQVKSVMQAVNLLGINNVRTLAISYCMAGMYNRLKVTKEEVDRYWQASLCKGLAAKTMAGAFDKKIEDSAFMAGLFQDMALPVMHAAAGEALTAILSNKELDADARIELERKNLGVDHTEIGRALATKLELPELYVDAIAFHHDAQCLKKFVESEPLANAVQAAALFPHLPNLWNPADVEKLTAFVAEKASTAFPAREQYLEVVQKGFDQLFGFFQPGETPVLRLQDLISDACAELADATTCMMGQMNTVMQEAARMGAAVSELAAKHDELASEGRRDALTGVLNRAGFLSQVKECLDAATKYSTPFAIMYLDVDMFKATNDTHGHSFGDFVLREICARVTPHLRKSDVFGRMGGDEFVIYLNDFKPEGVRALSDAIIKSIRHEPYAKGKVVESKTVSLGALCVAGQSTGIDLDTLIQEADSLMYMAKRSGPGQIRMRNYTPAAVS